MKARLSVIICLLFLIPALVCGCTQNTEEPLPVQTTAPSEVPAPEPGIAFTIATKSFAERYGDYYDSKRSYTTTIENVTYHFDVAIKEPARLEIINKCSRLIPLLLENHPEYTPDITLCFRPGDYPVRFIDHSLYIGTDHLDTREFAIGVAGAIFGEEVNYGLLYAHATQAAVKAGYMDAPQLLDIEEILTLCTDARAYLDMNYPCFLPQYTDDQTMQRVTSLALRFYDYLASTSRWDLFTTYSDAAYCTALSEYLATFGIEGYDNSDLENTVFYYGGPLIRLVWETADGTFYLEEDFETQYEMPHLTDRMNSGYPALRQTIVDYSAQIDFMENKLGQFESDSSERVDVLFAAGHATDRYSMANYSYSENLIRMFCAEPFLHEYGHYLLRETGIESWTNELICYYLGYLPVDEHISYMWSADAARIEASTGVEKDFVNSLKRKLGHAMDWSNPEDFEHIFTGYLALYNDFGVLTNPDAGAEAKVSFMYYLIGLADEEAVIQAIVNEDPAGTFGKEWEELIEDWTNSVTKEYKWIHNLYYIDGGK